MPAAPREHKTHASNQYMLGKGAVLPRSALSCNRLDYCNFYTVRGASCSFDTVRGASNPERSDRPPSISTPARPSTIHIYFRGSSREKKQECHYPPQTRLQYPNT